MKLKLSLFFILVSPLWGGETPTSKPANIYSPVGKRDPFRFPLANGQTRGVAALSPLERFNVEQLQLKAILRTEGKSRAMFEDPDGKTHIAFEGDILGRERATISRILNTEVIITQRTFNYLGQENLFEKVISLPPAEVASVPIETTTKENSAPKSAATGLLGGVPGVVKKIGDRPKELEKMMNEGNPTGKE